MKRMLLTYFFNRVMVPAFDHSIIWEGHASMITEISDDIQCKPDAIFCSVGGGGLLGGIILGCSKVGWDDGKLFAIPGVVNFSRYISGVHQSRLLQSKPKDATASIIPCP